METTLDDADETRCQDEGDQIDSDSHQTRLQSTHRKRFARLMRNLYSKVNGVNVHFHFLHQKLRQNVFGTKCFYSILKVDSNYILAKTGRKISNVANISNTSCHNRQRTFFRMQDFNAREFAAAREWY